MERQEEIEAESALIEEEIKNTPIEAEPKAVSENTEEEEAPAEENDEE